MIAIVAMTRARVIGAAGTLPWHYPEDLKFFRQTTTGHALLMGRKTFESIGKPLRDRRNIVLSRSMEPMPGVEVIRSVDELAQLPGLGSDGRKLFLIGGADLFGQLLPQCAGIYLTVVKKDYPGDTVLAEFEHLFDEGELLNDTADLEFRYHQRLA
jgi:dihydrofolate reductase